MILSPKEIETIQYQFNAFCKKVLKGELATYRHEAALRTKREITFSDLSEIQMLQLSKLSCIDEYSVEFNQFEVLGQEFIVKDDAIVEALTELTDEQRDIILLAYFLDLPDRIIAEKLGMRWHNIQYRRTCSLKKLREILDKRR